MKQFLRVTFALLGVAILVHASFLVIIKAAEIGISALETVDLLTIAFLCMMLSLMATPRSPIDG